MRRMVSAIMFAAGNQLLATVAIFVRGAYVQ